MTSPFQSSKAYPFLLNFGKYKGRHLQSALNDKELLKWIRNLSLSPIPKSAEIGSWYLRQIEPISWKPDLQIYVSIDLKELQAQIAIARNKIADLEATYTKEHQAVEGVRARLFLILRPTYERLDELRIQVEYRTRFLEALLEGHDDKAEAIAEAEQHARSSNHQAYEEASQAAVDRPTLQDQEQTELRAIYRRLAALYHPDKYVSDPACQASYIELMKQINQAKDLGDIYTLRDIAENPNCFLESTGHQSLDLEDETELESLELLHVKLKERIEELLMQLDELRSNSDFGLWKLCEQDPDFLDTIAQEQIRDLEVEAEKLKDECSVLADEINQILDPDSPFKVEDQTISNC